MGMLDRYRKAGGFVQLLNLLETSGKDKQEKFLTLIRQEDPNWAHALEQKILTIKKIFSWDAETLSEITGSIQEITLAVAIHGLDEEAKQKIFSMMGHSQRRKIDTLIESHNPTPAEISTMFMKILTEVRKMITEGKLRVEKFDPSLMVEEEIEEKLKKGALSSASEASDILTPLSGDDEIVTEDGTTLRFNLPPSKESKDEIAAADAAVANTVAAAAPQDVLLLRKKLIAFQNENTNLKQEVVRLKTKLDQIRKLSA